MKKIMVVLFCMIMLNSCEQTISPDNWTMVENANEIVGSWYGEKTITVAADTEAKQFYAEFFESNIPVTSILYTITLDYSNDNVNMEYGIRADFDKFLNDIVKTNNGRTKDSLWAQIITITSLFSYPEIDGTIGNHYVFSQLTLPATLSVFNDLSLSINQSQDKVKIITEMDGADHEIILHKR